ncbi:MAG: T9SS type A sorting domain-containing protein [Bacteroidales bacterium]|jgi:hypothetical protein|nr:T9SS type A sorting domain-containing protein [Bacteroidales bacterium]
MNRIFTILSLLTFSLLSYGQYVSPGTGATYTFDDLVSLSEGVVTRENGIYLVNHNLTISNTDKLVITTDLTVKVAGGRMLTFRGTFESNPPIEAIFTAQDPDRPFLGFHFIRSSASILRNTIVEYSGGVQLTETQMLIEDCVFRYNTMEQNSAAINLSNSSPIIRYNRFVENAGSAIASGASTTCSPQILFNHLTHNVTANTNRPQINMGPGAEDTLRIVGNTIEGLYPMAGGIAISNLLGVGQTRALVQDNRIYDNRYGYAQMGNNISSIVKGNHLLNNNIQNDPQQGGSGLNFYGTLNTNQALVLNNIIRGNLWGVTIQGNAHPNLGSPQRGQGPIRSGYNIIEGNGNTNTIYGLYNNTPNDIQAQFNFWGTDDPAEASTYVIGKNDNPSLGEVKLDAFWTPGDYIEAFAFEPEHNEILDAPLRGIIDHNDNTILVQVPVGTRINYLVPTITPSAYAQILPLTGQAMDFSMPVPYTVTPFEGPDRTYLVYIENIEVSLPTLTFEVLASGQPLPNATILFNGEAYEPGTYVFEELAPGTYDYLIERSGYKPFEGSVVAKNDDLTLVVELEPATSLESPLLSGRTLHVYPNPAKDHIEVNYSGQNGRNTVRIFSITGNMLLEIPNLDPGQRIDISNLDNGLYLLQFHQGNATLTRKFTVAR